MTDTTDNTPDENKLIAERRAKLAQLRDAGGASAFPNDFRRDSLAGQLHDAFGERDAAWLEANPTRVQVGGRILFKRIMGKASFVKIADRTGQIQLFLQQATEFLEIGEKTEIHSPVGAEVSCMFSPKGAAIDGGTTNANVWRT